MKDSTIIEEYTKGKKLTFECKMEDGSLRVYGELDLERLVKRLLESKYING
jgi:hypothetical protein